MFKVAILGCPNVGKSTLFNKLIRKYKSIIHDQPGVTRDYSEHICSINGQNIIMIDSPGWGYKDEFSSQTQKNIINVISITNLIIFVINTETTIQDKNFSLWLRRNSNLPVILAINKCEKEKYVIPNELGWENIVNISAQHAIGLTKLRERISSYINFDKQLDAVGENLKLTIVGRPNVGKSTLINELLQKNRVITSEIAGTTRDAIEVNWGYRGQNITLIDTAGMRKRSKVDEMIEASSVGASIHSIRQADVVILVLDAIRGFERQDLSIANLVIKEGKPIVVALNKCDLAEQQNLSHIKYCCSHHLSNGTEVVIVSAIKGENCNEIIDYCIRSHKSAKQKISTAKLNKWLYEMIKKHEPPLSSRKTPIRFKFISQIANTPLIFKIVANITEDINKNYIRYLENNLRKEFNLGGAPIKILLEKNHNPYVKES